MTTKEKILIEVSLFVEKHKHAPAIVDLAKMVGVSRTMVYKIFSQDKRFVRSLANIHPQYFKYL